MLMKKISCEKGVGLIEILFSLWLIAIMSLGLGSNIVSTFRTHKSVLISEAVNDLAIERVEVYSSINPLEMTQASHGDSENSLTVPYIKNMTFTRTTTITVNADTSRTINVVVTCNHAGFANKTTTLETTFIRW